jgi:hypothetical protein
MTRSIFSKVMWVGRATVFVVGLAVILALTVGLATTALAGTGVGARFQLGQTNTVNAITKLVGSVAGPSLQIDNNSTNANATALNLQVEAGKAPMKVNSETKVANLNADKLDGLDSGAFLGVTAKATDSLHADQATNATDSDTLDGKDSHDFMTGHYYIRTANSGPFNPGTANGIGAQQADCDPNDLALSGGYDDVDQGTHVFRNRFIVSVSQQGEERPFTWNVGWVNDSSPDTIKVWALCLDR